MLIKLENNKPIGNPISNENFYQLFPNISFPFPLYAEAVEPIGYGLYEFSVKPEISTYEKVIEVNPIKNDSGVWFQSWKVVSMNQEEVNQKNEELKLNNKQTASFLLSQTDWVELGDVTNPSNPPYLANKADFTAYRQQLRAISIDPPVTVEQWPVKPQEVWSSQ